MKKIIIYCILALMSINPILALEARTEKYEIDFKTAYELMFENNNSLKALNEDIKVKKYKKRSAIGQYLPKIGLNATFVRFNKDIKTDVSSIDMGGATVPVPNIKIQDKSTSIFGFDAVWNIFTGGKIYANHKKARAELLGSNLKYKSSANTLTTKLVQYYWGLRLMEDVSTVRAMVKNTMGEHLSDAKKMEREGIIAKSQRLHAEVAYKQAEKDYNTSLKDIEIAQEALKNLIKDDNLDLEDIYVEPKEGLFLYRGQLPSLDEMRLSAIENNPDLKQLEVQKNLASANYIANASNYSPVVSLFAYDVLAQSDLASQLPRFGAGASINLMLFDGFSRYNDLKAAGALKNEVKFMTVAARNNIESLTVKNYNELLKYKEEYESLNKTLEDAKESLRCAMIAFREGIGTSLDVTDAETSYAAIKIQRLNALYNYDVKLAELLSNTGNSEKIFEYLENSSEEKL